MDSSALINRVREEFQKEETNKETHLYKMWNQAPSSRKDLMAMAIACRLWNVASPELCKKGPSPKIMASFILGDSPKDLSNNTLTRAEADRWINQCETDPETGFKLNYKTPLEWLWKELQDDFDCLEGCGAARSIKVARWLRNVLENPETKKSALRNRANEFGGDMIEGRVIDRLDEIEDCDLRKSPRRTIEAAVQRIVDSEWSGSDEMLEKQDWFYNLPEGVKILWKYTDLRMEGKKMHHCAVAYAKKIANGGCMIFSIIDPISKNRSTAEIVNGKCVQHVGFGNGEVPAECLQILNQLITLQPWNQT